LWEAVWPLSASSAKRTEPTSKHFPSSSRLQELVDGNGIAIVDENELFGGGALNHYGINSNTSAYSFIKFLYQKKVFHKADDDNQEGEQLKETQPGANNKKPS